MPLAGEYEPSSSQRVRDQVEQYERTDGREGKTPLDLPIIVLTTVGAKSGRLRKTPLMRVELDGEYAVVASKGGAPEHPVWYFNIANEPHVELQDGAVKRDYLAHEATGDERARWWDRAVAAYPPYADYQEKTTRQIPLFVLTPTGEEA